MYHHFGDMPRNARNNENGNFGENSNIFKGALLKVAILTNTAKMAI